MVEIEDVSPFVAEQRERLATDVRSLVTPTERVYDVSDSETAAWLRIGG